VTGLLVADAGSGSAQSTALISDGCMRFMTTHSHLSNPPHIPPVGISIDEAIRLSNLGRTSLFAALADGSIKSTKVGRRRIVSYRSLVEFIEGDGAAA
jgi:hypothetical protein